MKKTYLTIAIKNKAEWQAIIDFANKQGQKVFAQYYNTAAMYLMNGSLGWENVGTSNENIGQVIYFDTFSQLTGVEVVNEIHIEVDTKTTITVLIDGIKIKDNTGVFYMEANTLEEIYTAYKSLQ